MSIGWLPENSDLAHAGLQMDQLRDYLLSRETIQRELERMGYEGIVIAPCDGPEDMIQRLRVGEFQVAFATAMIYARAELLSSAPDRYMPIWQTWLAGDLDPATRQGVLRRGVVIVGPASPLFKAADPSGQALREQLSRAPLAVTTAHSSAGYVYPLIKFTQQHGAPQPPAYWFCGTDAEVVKHVVSGLAEVGLCREGVLNELLPENGREGFCRVVLESDPFPTDPVLIRNDLRPEATDLGQELKIALRTYFMSEREELPRLLLKESPARAYDDFARVVGQFMGEGVPGALRSPMPNEGLPPAIPTSGAILPVDPLETTSRSLTVESVPGVTPAIEQSPSPAPSESPTPTPPSTPTPTPSPTPQPRLTPVIPGIFGGEEDGS